MAQILDRKQKEKTAQRPGAKREGREEDEEKGSGWATDRVGGLRGSKTLG
jgi:hypothetical protein